MEKFSPTILMYILTGWFFSWAYQAMRRGSIHQQARSIILEAEHAIREKQEKTKAEFRDMKLAYEAKVQHEISSLEKEKINLKQDKKKLRQEEEKLKKEIIVLERTKKNITENEVSLQKAHDETQKRLEKIAKLNFEDARKELWHQLEAQCKNIHEKRIQEWQTLYDQECQERASSILFCALERKAQALTKETFLTNLSLPEVFIPKIIGKEGRNIHTLEELLGVFLWVEESEKKLWISAHDPKRRSLTKATIERILNETKITPVTIKNAYEATVLALPKITEEKAREACKKLHIHENFPIEILRSLGELSLRSTAGQNTLLHSIEVAELMGIAAKELGLCSETAKIMGLFHDIGKTLSTEWGTSHASAGAKFLEHFGIEEKVVSAVASHHKETDNVSQEAKLLLICDKLSAQLPGARHEQKPLFLTLVHECECIAKKAQGVTSAWAHYGGDHIELMIRSKSIDSMLLKSNLEQSINSIKPRLPVKISILE